MGYNINDMYLESQSTSENGYKYLFFWGVMSHFLRYRVSRVQVVSWGSQLSSFENPYYFFV